MATVETITLVIAIFWALWQLLSLRNAAINGEGVFPAMIPAFFLFVGAIATVLQIPGVFSMPVQGLLPYGEWA